ncbi:Gfo/Idh/MocA family oxidoreductase [Thalassobacillus sp. CUG 92003]|uniref:Gfo/Idh/MocA family oxidoreductase n=1 Tax=Thalassobacillus sp. CUG 92003 TaxID=2736641 RepID=UPI0015E63A8F|nr:Gfo/Idh/MocA family oxidoreductase [Thalassobacillus sp. CUG 92003]
MAVDNIAIIGAGQIGRRHMQALKLIDRPIRLHVVDTSDASLHLAKQLYDQSPPPRYKQEVKYVSDLSALPQDLSLVIIATTSRVRETVLHTLLQEKSAASLIMEKVVFQHADAFQNASDHMTAKNVQAWVNCPMRTYPFFKNLKSLIAQSPYLEDTITYTISGSRWNLASNAIHQLDLLAFLSDESEFKLDSGSLHSTIVDSKRDGFLEVTGSLTGTGRNGQHITMTSFAEGSAPLVIDVHTANVRCIVRPSEQKAWISEPVNNWTWRETNCVFPYQSQLTHFVAQSILDDRTCELPSFSLSWQLHLPLLQSLTNHFNNQRKEDVTKCPIS